MEKSREIPNNCLLDFSGIFALYSGSFGGEPPALHFHLQLSLLFTEYLNRYINAFL